MDLSSFSSQFLVCISYCFHTIHHHTARGLASFFPVSFLAGEAVIRGKDNPLMFSFCSFFNPPFPHPSPWLSLFLSPPSDRAAQPQINWGMNPSWNNDSCSYVSFLNVHGTYFHRYIHKHALSCLPVCLWRIKSSTAMSILLFLFSPRRKQELGCCAESNLFASYS